MNKSYSESGFEYIRDKMHALRHNYFDKMDKYLLDLETVLTGRGIDVIWTKDDNSVLNALKDFTDNNSIKSLAFDTSLDLESNFNGVFSIFKCNELEKSNNDVDLLVIDSDFAVCDSGSLVFLERKSKNCFNKAKNIFVIVKIDQVIASVEDLSLFLSIKEKKGIPSDIKIINSKPKYVEPISSVFSSEQSVSEVNLTVLFYLNDIEDILLSEDILPTLYCINCGKCMDVCPVAAADGDCSPIDIVRLNSLDKYNRDQHIFKHTTLCGACDKVCPVKVPITNLLLFEMQASNLAVKPSKTKHLFSIFSKRSSLNKFNNRFLKFIFIKRFFGQNKMLGKYFQENSNDFFNINYNPPHEDNPNEILKDSDFE